ncbi:MAG: hypothetical protein KZQ66_00715 [Candidatus Thiodiazotropha sp. (ex Lucinoma aequizonata)]|nr:hypothetical protein [Candidatus Thiodiazotropha sp. (ex Lucinoma aequizonata)]MCU7900714.1 hypothetical protein [Candidatus Thiodiazotropha sp. (ex Lucinoma aequizonata)]
MIKPEKNQIVEVVSLWKNTASLLKGGDRRQFMGNVVNLIGRGSQCFAEEVLGWNRALTGMESGAKAVSPR